MPCKLLLSFLPKGDLLFEVEYQHHDGDRAACSQSVKYLSLRVPIEELHAVVP
jgi:hypothetical protein